MRACSITNNGCFDGIINGGCVDGVFKRIMCGRQQGEALGVAGGGEGRGGVEDVGSATGPVRRGGGIFGKWSWERE